jgi:tetraacyldisaccharide 4'-kinase
MLRGLLRLAELPYAWAVKRRNWAFDLGQKERLGVGIPVISVGNLTLGGTGKTPFVEWLTRWFMHRGVNIALVSRGYKAAQGAPNDEAQELAQKLPGVPHLQNADRVAAARLAVQKFQAELVILDDGFQHRRLERNLDVVLLDALEPFGFGHLFPRGMLREPLSSLGRAQVAVLTRADMVNDAERARIRSVVLHYAPHIAWAECRHAPHSLLLSDGQQEPLEAIRNRRVVAFCGLGNPAGFRHTLAECGCNVVAWREFPDHFVYNQNSIQELSLWAASHDVEAVLCTHKDLVKLAVNDLGNRPLRAVLVGLEFLRGQEELETNLETLLTLCPNVK